MNLSRLVLVLLLALPWVSPWAPGPSTAAPSLLVAWACAGLFMLLRGAQAAADRAAGLTGQGGRPTLRPLVEVLAPAWLGAAVLSACIGLLQYQGLAPQFAGWIHPTGLGEAFANLRQRNQFATLTNIGLVALIVEGLRRRADDGAVQTASPGLRAAGAVAVVLLMAGNAASSSRTGLLQLLLLLLLPLVWRSWRRPVVLQGLGLALAAYGVSALLLPITLGQSPVEAGVLARLQSGESGCASRWVLWRNVLELVSLRPWAGWGWGELDYAHFVTPFAGPRFCAILDNAHNLPLHLAVELGVPAALLLCGGMAWAVWRTRPWREVDPARQLAWGVLVLILLHSLLEYPLWYGPFQVAAVLCVALLLGGTPAADRRWQGPLSLLLGLVLVLSASYGLWDYHRIRQIYLPVAQRAPAWRQEPLRQASASWLFRDQVRFAALTTRSLTPENAAWVQAESAALLHFSPEPRVIEKWLDSRRLLGQTADTAAMVERYRAAFPSDFERWARRTSP